MNKRIFSLLMIAVLTFCMIGCSEQPANVGDPENQSDIQESDLGEGTTSQGSGENKDKETVGSTGTEVQDGDTPVSNDGGSDVPSGDTPVSNNPFGGQTEGSTGGGETGNSVGNGNSASSEGSTGNVDGSSGTITTVPEKTEDCTYAEYHAMTPEAQQAFFAKFDSVEDFFVWYNAAKAQHEKDNAAIEIGDGEINLGEVIGSGK